MIHGSCCCGAVRFVLTALPTMMAACHCTRCRKVGAGVFVIVRRETFQWVQGADRVARFTPSRPFQFTRCFCEVCGTALGEPFAEAESFPIAANCLDDDPGLSIRFHEWVSEKPAWFEIGDNARQFPLHPVKG